MDQHRLKMMYKRGCEWTLLFMMIFGIWGWLNSSFPYSELVTFLMSLGVVGTGYGLQCWLQITFTSSLFKNKLFSLFNILVSLLILSQLNWEGWTPLKWVSTPYQIRLVLHETSNPRSLGSEIWFDSIEVNNQLVYNEDLINHEGWFKVENGYAPVNIENSELIFTEFKNEIVRMTFLKTPYSGIIDIYQGGKIVDTLDLYSESLDTVSFIVSPIKGMTFWLMQLGIGLALILGFNLGICVCVLLVKRQYRQRFQEIIKSYFDKFKIITSMFMGRIKGIFLKYKVQFITIWMIYGVWTAIENLSNLSIGFKYFILGIALTIGIWLYNTIKKIFQSQLSIRYLIIFLCLLTTLIGLKYPINSIQQPLNFLVPSYDLTLVATGNKQEKSLGNEIWITGIYVNGQPHDVNSWGMSEGWISTGTTIVNDTQSESIFTIPNLQGESVTVEFLKSAYSGEVEVYRNNRLIRTVDLYRGTSANVQIKFSPDYVIQLLLAKLGFILWGTLVLSCIMFSLLERLIRKYKKSNLIIWLLSIIQKNKLLNEKSSIIKQILQCTSPSDFMRVTLYSSFPLCLLITFYYVGNWTFEYEWLSYFIFFTGILLLEKYIRKTWTDIFLQLNIEQLMRKLRLVFYGMWFSLVLVILMGIIYYMPSLDLAWYWLDQNTSLLILTTTLVIAIYGIGYSLTNHGLFTIGVVFLSFIIFGITDYLKRTVAGEPLYPADLAMVTKVDTLLGYLNGISPLMIFVILGITIVLLVLLFIFIQSTKLSWKSRVILLIFSLAYVLCFVNYEKTFMREPVKSIAQLEKWNQISNYNMNGTIIGFISNLQNDIMEKPDKYSQEIIQNIIDEKKEKLINNQNTSFEKPNVVVIVDESFSDPLQLSQLSFSEDPIPTVRYYQSQGSSGYLLSPFKGGSTANVEFEFLTSLSNSFLTKGSVPFQQSLSIKKNFPSIVSYFNKLGYETVAIHPNNKSFYKRNQVYPNIGFQQFIGVDDLTYTERIANQLFISDESVFNELIKIIETNPDPSFVYGLTIQNHLPIEEGKFGLNNITVKDSTGERIEELETYVQGLKLTDEYLRNFMEKIERLDEPTIVIFFGDHLVNFESKVHQEHGYIYGDKNGDVTKMFYQTPLFIWSNTSNLNTKSITSISPNFLMPVVLDALNLPMTPYYQLLLDVYELFGALHPNFKLDRDEKNIDNLTEEQKQLLLEYELIQYDLLQGKGYSLQEMFTPIYP